ncbi:hypothetical protein O1L60_32160 [Streptomyces diastatochromogenes]|nr:hypothetical protein [Streptomyces diastatochromogenes]
MQAPLVSTLLDNGTLVVCVGGGGVPVRTDSKGRQIGMQAVVDKDAASAALAADLKADMLIMLTDGDFVSENWGTPSSGTSSPPRPRAWPGSPSPRAR